METAVVQENAIYITDNAKAKVIELMTEAGLGSDYFVRVGVAGGGCSGLSYKLDFDNETKPMDQVFEDKGINLPIRKTKHAAGYVFWFKNFLYFLHFCNSH